MRNHGVIERLFVELMAKAPIQNAHLNDDAQFGNGIRARIRFAGGTPDDVMVTFTGYVEYEVRGDTLAIQFEIEEPHALFLSGDITGETIESPSWTFQHANCPEGDDETYACTVERIRTHH